jgi:hypothetical protein
LWVNSNKQVAATLKLYQELSKLKSEEIKVADPKGMLNGALMPYGNLISYTCHKTKRTAIRALFVL